MKIFADDPLTQRILSLIGLGGSSSQAPLSSANDSNMRAPLKRVTPVAGGALFSGFAPTRPTPQPSSTDLAISATKQAYSWFSKIKSALNLNLSEPAPTGSLQSASSAFEFGEEIPLSQVSGGELALDGAAVDFFADAAPLAEVSGGELALAGGGTGGSGGGAGVGGAVAFTAPVATGEAAATAGATGTAVAAGETVTLATLGPVGLIAGITVAVATGIHMLIKSLLPRDLPFGRGQVFSAADNMSSQKSKLLGIRGADAVIAYIKSHPNFRDLIRLANAGANLSPHGEVIFHHPTAGLGASFYNNASPEYTELLNKVWNGDVLSLKTLVQGIEVYTGETGATHPHWEATDWYRRSLVHAVPAQIQALLAPIDLLWQPMPGYQTMDETYYAYLFPGGIADANAIQVVNDAGGIDNWIAAREKDTWNGCPFFRDLQSASYHLTDLGAARIRAAWPYPHQVFYDIETGTYREYRLGDRVFDNAYEYSLAAQELANNQGDGGGGD